MEKRRDQLAHLVSFVETKSVINNSEYGIRSSLLTNSCGALDGKHVEKTYNTSRTIHIKLDMKNSKYKLGTELRPDMWYFDNRIAMKID